MKIAVLDVGSVAAKLEMVDCRPGVPLTMTRAIRVSTRLAEHTTRSGEILPPGIERVAEAVRRCVLAAAEGRATALLAYATSAVRDAVNQEVAIESIRAQSGIDLAFLRPEDEARLSYFAARRWYGWSYDQLALIDIGGGTMEVALGVGEEPSLAASLPLGAARLTREFLSGAPSSIQLQSLTAHVREALERALRGPRRRLDGRTRFVGGSKILTQLYRLASGAGGDDTPRPLLRSDLQRWIPPLARLEPRHRAVLPGVSSSRSAQILAGAVVAEAAMELLGSEGIDICPWGLRDAILLRLADAYRLVPDLLEQWVGDDELVRVLGVHLPVVAPAVIGAPRESLESGATISSISALPAPDRDSRVSKDQRW
ncbi:Ppx/GppA phosphatase family protein [Actinoalloteichus hymeniacidonis]|uniref:Ppx/GppA phosphatase family n=1 Tax=Actinoalloteichus hymeniacidonis TaxID=340345 RepID=A0AAC9HT58_9PSEU|nr:hypothetical protein [Actinoalloteichus hymeniacidonis]AOS64869.1 Ppx/GppA phosphatase family [Actinoalloteichus hymeniacidonis]MBB5907056.1 exopolyphosphatase/guanosine-5'-triphosphate,3'-diphosphate pyrophosphatase [Actinoalloteichus hymeniacidonis]